MCVCLFLSVGSERSFFRVPGWLAWSGRTVNNVMSAHSAMHALKSYPGYKLLRVAGGKKNNTHFKRSGWDFRPFIHRLVPVRSKTVFLFLASPKPRPQRRQFILTIIVFPASEPGCMIETIWLQPPALARCAWLLRYATASPTCTLGKGARHTLFLTNRQLLAHWIWLFSSISSVSALCAASWQQLGPIGNASRISFVQCMLAFP